MYDHHTLIAQQSERRYIARCESGQLHLTWDQVTVHLRPIDFLRVAHMLDQARSHADQQVFCAGPLWFLRDAHGCIHFWMGSVCLWLPPVDFEQFIALAQVVIEHYSRDPASSSSDAPGEHRSMVAQPRFSQN